MKSMKMFAAISAIVAAPLAPISAWSSTDHDKHSGNAVTVKAAAEAASMSDGEVRKVDKDAKKITIKHGELKNLGMPAMTMVFQVKDATLLEKVKAGDKVKFRAEKVSGGYAVGEIEVAK